MTVRNNDRLMRINITTLLKQKSGIYHNYLKVDDVIHYYQVKLILKMRNSVKQT